MPVVNINDLWPNSRVPLVFENAAAEKAMPWIEEVNKVLGYSLLVPKESSDENWIKVLVPKEKEHSKSEKIGCGGKGEQTIKATNKYSLQHELLHALGFRHEQLHEDFAWDDSDVPPKEIERIFGPKKRIPGEFNVKLLKQIESTMGNLLAAELNLKSRADMMLQKGKLVRHLDPCDYSSIMMYPAMRKAVEGVNDSLPKGKRLILGKLKTEFLTEHDVAALLELYPEPPPPAPEPPKEKALPEQYRSSAQPEEKPLIDKAVKITSPAKFLVDLRKTVGDLIKKSKQSGVLVFLRGKDTPLLRSAVTQVVAELDKKGTFTKNGWKVDVKYLIDKTDPPELNFYPL